MKKKSKILFMIIVTCIWMMQPVNSLASETVSGNDICNVAFSTVPENMFTFIMDPQGIIHATDAVKYGGASFGEGNLFFQNEEMSYSNTSNYMQIINGGYTELQVTVTAVLNASDKIQLVDNKDFDKEDCSLYLALKDENGETPIMNNGGSKVAELTTVIPASSGGMGEIYEFALTGECNAAGTWETIPLQDICVDITWFVEPISSTIPRNVEMFIAKTEPAVEEETMQETEEETTQEIFEEAVQETEEEIVEESVGETVQETEEKSTQEIGEEITEESSEGNVTGQETEVLEEDAEVIEPLSEKMLLLEEELLYSNENE